MDEAPDNRLHAEQTDAVEQLGALRATVDSQILGTIRAAGESEVWKVDGAPSLIEWAGARLKLTRSEARRHVEVAETLATLPAIAAGLDEGSLSFSQVCVLVDFVAPADDAERAERLGVCP